MSIEEEVIISQLKADRDRLLDAFDKIKAEIYCNIIEDDTSGNTPARLRADWEAANKAHKLDLAIIDKYITFKEESEIKK